MPLFDHFMYNEQSCCGFNPKTTFGPQLVGKSPIFHVHAYVYISFGRRGVVGNEFGAAVTAAARTFLFLFAFLFLLSHGVCGSAARRVGCYREINRSGTVLFSGCAKIEIAGEFENRETNRKQKRKFKIGIEQAERCLF